MNVYPIDDIAGFQADRQGLDSYLQQLHWSQKPAAQALLKLLDDFAAQGMFDEDAFLVQAEQLWAERVNLQPGDRASLLLLLTRFHALAREFPIEAELYPFLYEEVLRNPLGYGPSNRVFWGDLIFNALVHKMEGIRSGETGPAAKSAVRQFLVSAQALLKNTEPQPLAYAMEWYLQQCEPLDTAEADAFHQDFAGYPAVLKVLAQRPR